MNTMGVHGLQQSPQQGGPMQPMQQLQPPPQQSQQAQQQPPEKLNNIAKVKSLVGPLRESLTATLKSAAQVLHQNYLVDSQKTSDGSAPPRFDKNMEEFYSICDQMEMHLKTSIACLQQANWASQHLPLAVHPSRTDPQPQPDPPTPPALSYPQFLTVAKLQVSYAKEIHDTLVAAAQNMPSTE